MPCKCLPAAVSFRHLALQAVQKAEKAAWFSAELFCKVCVCVWAVPP